MSIIDTAIGKANQFADFIKPHMPVIEVVVGTVAVGAGGFITGRASIKVHDILDEHKKAVDETRREINGLTEEEYSETERKQDVVRVYSVTARKVAGTFAPGIGLCVFGVTAICHGVGTLKNWHSLAVSAAASISEQFADYRGNVINELGAEADQKFLVGDVVEQNRQHKEVDLEVRKIDEDGNEVTETKQFVSFNDLTEDDFTRIYNWRCGSRWETDFLYADNFIHRVQADYTKHLQSHRMNHVFMNTLFKDFGFSETGVGHFYGWTDKPGCCVGIDVTPYIELWSDESDSQFPMYVTFETERDNELGDWHFLSKEDERLFRDRYAEDNTKVGFILHFDVDKDANGVPKNIYYDVYGK